MIMGAKQFFEIECVSIKPQKMGSIEYNILVKILTKKRRGMFFPKQLCMKASLMLGQKSIKKVDTYGSVNLQLMSNKVLQVPRCSLYLSVLHTNLKTRIMIENYQI